VFVPRGLGGTAITSQRKDFCDPGAFRNCVLVDADHFTSFFSGMRFECGSEMVDGVAMRLPQAAPDPADMLELSRNRGERLR